MSSEGRNEAEGWRYKSAMGGSRGGIMMRSTCGRVNSTDATKISIRGTARVMATRRYRHRDISCLLFYLTFAMTSSRAIKRAHGLVGKNLNDMLGKSADVIELRLIC